ncbi:MAG: CBS domain-containing protein [Chloroflexi bacterium]|jgi:CBS domain-containing protein|nr:MAG: CBS domain-containing protein [Chloroflexota bacterium]
MKTAQHVMTRALHTISPDASVADASRKMQQHKIHSLIVERCDGLDAYGIITDTDIVQKVLAPDFNPAAVYVREVMSKPIITIPPDCTLFEMAQLMTRHHINHLPVFDGTQLVGMVSSTDIFSVK